MARPEKFLLEPRRQVAILRGVVVADHPDLPRLEIAATGAVIVIPVIAVIMLLPVCLPVTLILVPVLGPLGRRWPTHEKAGKNHIK
jgi:hypothetical protein